jgi:hypothetical protein
MEMFLVAVTIGVEVVTLAFPARSQLIMITAPCVATITRTACHMSTGQLYNTVFCIRWQRQLLPWTTSTKCFARGFHLGGIQVRTKALAERDVLPQVSPAQSLPYTAETPMLTAVERLYQSSS